MAGLQQSQNCVGLCISLQLILHFLVFSCNSFTLPGISERREMMIMPNPTPQMQCFHNGTYYLGDIPSTDSCRSYYTCVPSGTIPNGTEMTHRPCQNGHDGKPLVYDFRSCSCLSYEEGAVCYDPGADDHLEHFYHCTEPYVPWKEEDS